MSINSLFLMKNRAFIPVDDDIEASLFISNTIIFRRRFQSFYAVTKFFMMSYSMLEYWFLSENLFQIIP